MSALLNDKVRKRTLIKQERFISSHIPKPPKRPLVHNTSFGYAVQSSP